MHSGMRRDSIVSESVGLNFFFSAKAEKVNLGSINTQMSWKTVTFPSVHHWKQVFVKTEFVFFQKMDLHQKCEQCVCFTVFGYGDHGCIQVSVNKNFLKTDRRVQCFCFVFFKQGGWSVCSCVNIGLEACLDWLENDHGNNSKAN